MYSKRATSTSSGLPVSAPDQLYRQRFEEALDQRVIFDSAAQNVMMRMAYASDAKNRTERAEAGAIEVNANYDAKLAAFLAFVIGQYEDTLVEHLDRSRMPDNLKLKYGNPAEGAKALGGVDQVVETFVGY